jgi:hypothetical protein
LDWSTKTTNDKINSIIVRDFANNYYCFTFDEIIQIFHTDLSRSNAEIEPNYNVCSVQKSFRLPHNPYSNLCFSVLEIKQILSQILLIRDKMLNFKKFPEVCFFLFHYIEIVDACKDLSPYYTTDFLNEFFESLGLMFKEKIINNQNHSKWIYKSNDNFYLLMFS